MALVDRKAKAPDTFVLRRGDYRNKGPKVAPRPPGVILASQGPQGVRRRTRSSPTDDKTGRRAALARWLAGKDNPLAARVIVNRLWQYHFTPGDRGHVERFRRAGRAAVASRAARLAGLRADRRRLAAQADPPADRDLGDLSPVQQAGRQARRGRSRQHPAGPDESPPARRRGHPRRDARRLGRAESQDGRARRAGPAREGGQGPDLHRGRGRRPLARGR